MKEKTLFKTLVPTIAMLMVAILALSGVTYAWFTSSNNASISDFQLNVSAAEGLLISADNAIWKSTITIDEIKTAQSSVASTLNAQDFALAPVSAANSNVSNGAATFYKAEADGDTLASSVAATGGYVAFDLYFQNAGASAKTVYLTNSGVNNGMTGDSANELTSALASRIGLIRQGDSAIGAAEITGTKDTSMTIFEPNATQHTAAGLADYKAHFSTATSSSKFDTYALKAASATSIANRWATGTAIATTTTGDASATTFSLPAQKTTKVTFYVWVEGQDADCLNDVAGKALTVDLNFTTEAPTAGN